MSICSRTLAASSLDASSALAPDLPSLLSRLVFLCMASWWISTCRPSVEINNAFGSTLLFCRLSTDSLRDSSRFCVNSPSKPETRWIRTDLAVSASFLSLTSIWARISFCSFRCDTFSSLPDLSSPATPDVPPWEILEHLKQPFPTKSKGKGSVLAKL